MSRRALAEKRPLLLASIVVALAFYYLRWQPWPELYLIPLKGAAVGLLAIYLWLRHSSPDARLMAWAFGAAALGDMSNRDRPHDRRAAVLRSTTCSRWVCTCAIAAPQPDAEPEGGGRGACCC